MLNEAQLQGKTVNQVVKSKIALFISLMSLINFYLSETSFQKKTAANESSAQ